MVVNTANDLIKKAAKAESTHDNEETKRIKQELEKLNAAISYIDTKMKLLKACEKPDANQAGFDDDQY